VRWIQFKYSSSRAHARHLLTFKPSARSNEALKTQLIGWIAPVKPVSRWRPTDAIPVLGACHDLIRQSPSQEINDAKFDDEMCSAKLPVSENFADGVEQWSSLIIGNIREIRVRRRSWMK
jgi:hypothetical protein